MSLVRGNKTGCYNVMRIRTAILTIVLTFFLMDAFAAPSSSGTVIRVLIADDREIIRLSLEGRYKITQLNSAKVVDEGSAMTVDVEGASNGLKIGRKIINTPGVKISVKRNGNIYIDNRRYRGELDILKKDGGRLMAINYLDIDEYLYGVLYHEVSHRWPMECLKAQAIAARTFALYQMKQNKLQPYDLRSDIYSQVYGGQRSEKWATTSAVNQTKGLVMTFKDEIVPAYYHATCAGYTENSSTLWETDIAPLKGVACSYCVMSPHFRWTKEISLKDLGAKLKAANHNIGDVMSVTILSKNDSGRVDKIELKDERGVCVVITGKDLRQIIGPNEIRSTKFDTEVKKNRLILRGQGWGHGVGMCQWGAYGMSKNGKRAEEILKYYYPGTEITAIDKLKQ